MNSGVINRVLWGLVLVGIGVVYLLNQLGIVHVGLGTMISTFWPVIMIVYGLQGVLTQRGLSIWPSLIVLSLGCYFLARNLGFMYWGLSDMIRIAIPIVLIGFGFHMIARSSRSGRHTEQKTDQWQPITPPPYPHDAPPPESQERSTPPVPPTPPPAPPYDEFDPHTGGKTQWGQYDQQQQHKSGYQQDYNAGYKPGEDSYDQHDRQHNRQHNRQERDRKWDAGFNDWYNPRRLNYNKFIGDVHLGQDYWEVRPANISMFIGDTVLDLTKAQIPLGETKIYVSSFIGDVKVFLPSDMGVGIRVVSSCFIGDVRFLDQKRGGMFNHLTEESPFYADTDRKIHLVVSSFIGDVKIMKVG